MPLAFNMYNMRTDHTEAASHMYLSICLDRARQERVPRIAAFIQYLSMIHKVDQKGAFSGIRVPEGAEIRRLGIRKRDRRNPDWSVVGLRKQGEISCIDQQHGLEHLDCPVLAASSWTACSGHRQVDLTRQVGESRHLAGAPGLRRDVHR